MSPAAAFRLLLIAAWLLPFAIWRLDLAIYMARPHATALVAGPPVTQVRLLLENLALWLGWLALLAGALATAGLWRFRHWGIYTFAVSVTAFVGYVGLCDFFEYKLLPQTALLVQGVPLGAIAAWLLLARPILPFKPRTRAA